MYGTFCVMIRYKMWDKELGHIIIVTSVVLCIIVVPALIYIEYFRCDDIMSSIIYDVQYYGDSVKPVIYDMVKNWHTSNCNINDIDDDLVAQLGKYKNLLE